MSLPELNDSPSGGCLELLIGIAIAFVFVFGWKILSWILGILFVFGN